MTVTIGVVLAANALLLENAGAVGRPPAVHRPLAGTVFGPASSVFFDTLLAYLERGRQVLLWLGLILVVVGWFAGSNASGAAVRRTLSGGLETAGAALGGGPVGGAGRWVAANARWLRVAVGVLGAVVLLWGNDMSHVEADLVNGAGRRAPGVVQVLVGAAGATAATPVPQPTQAVTGDA
jgi:hypothetical protein